MNLPNTFQQFFDNTGKPLSNGKLYSYTAGSTNLPKPLYSDFGLTIERPNPVILDASGRPGVSYMTSGGYNLVLKDSADILIEQWDYQNGTGSSTSGTSDSYKVKVDQFDTEDYLVEKVISGDGIDVVNVTGSQRQLQINNQGKVKTNSGDTLGYLDQKYTDSASIKWSEIANKMVATVEVSAISATIPGDRKTVVDEEDLDAPGYLVDKIVAGTGPITVTTESSGQHKQLHVNVFDVGKVSVSENDSYNYLNTKIKAGSGITITSASDINGESLWINSKTNIWRNVTYKNTDYTINDATDTIGITGPFVVITLPDPSETYNGRIVYVYCTGSGTSCSISNSFIVGEWSSIYDYQKAELICVAGPSGWVWLMIVTGRHDA